MTTGRTLKVKKVQNIEKAIRMLKIEKIRKNYKSAIGTKKIRALKRASKVGKIRTSSVPNKGDFR